jgi:hypothetical protein
MQASVRLMLVHGSQCVHMKVRVGTQRFPIHPFGEFLLRHGEVLGDVLLTLS